jgi:hypothetical protein
VRVIPWFRRLSAQDKGVHTQWQFVHVLATGNLALSESLRDLVVTADDFFEAFEAAADGFDSGLQQLLVCRLTVTERFAQPFPATS